MKPLTHKEMPLELLSFHGLMHAFQIYTSNNSSSTYILTTSCILALDISLIFAFSNENAYFTESLYPSTSLGVIPSLNIPYGKSL
jgi:hypothetical protein